MRYLGNVDSHIHFAVLSDFPDADVETAPDDAAIVEAATRGVTALNERHGADRFMFLHRARRLNPATGRWMGWERKRGKIEEFNRLVLGHDDTSFSVRVGESASSPAAGTSSRSTPTRSCRPTARGGWSAPSRIR